jgi:peptide/nickel transport system substrate-binding protein
MPTNFGAGGDMELTGYWKNDECARLLDVLQSSVDMDTRRSAQRRILEIVERDDPAVIVLHETANFTGKRKDIVWKPARSFVMDFRSRNFRMS